MSVVVGLPGVRWSGSTGGSVSAPNECRGEVWSVWKTGYPVVVSVRTMIKPYLYCKVFPFSYLFNPNILE